MSVNDVTLSFTAPNSQKKTADKYVKVVNSCLLVKPASDHIYEVDKQKHKFTFIDADIDDKKLESFFTELNAYNANDPVVSCLFGKTGETDYYTIIKGRLKYFESLEEYKLARKGKTTPNKSLDYNLLNPERNDNLLVLLRVKDKKNQQAIMDMFTPLQEGITDDTLDVFSKTLSTIKSSHDNKKHLRCEDGTIGFFGLNERWFDGPANLMKGFVFTQAVGDFVYLGFDMSKIGWEAPTGSPRRKEGELWMRGESLENIVDALGPVFFRSDKCWAKYWPGEDKEIFAFSFGDDSASTTRAITKVDDWDIPR